MLCMFIDGGSHFSHKKGGVDRTVGGSFKKGFLKKSVSLTRSCPTAEFLCKVKF